MPEQVIMPRLSDTMTEGTVSKWLKHPGDEVKKGEPIVEIETDKANIELEAYATGKLARIVLQEGQSAPVGDLIGEISLPGEAASPSPEAQAPASTSGPAPAPPAPAAPESEGAAVATTDAKRPEAAQLQAQAAAAAAAANEPSPAAAGEGRVRVPEAPTAAPMPLAQPAGGHDHELRASPMARRLARELGVDLASLNGSGPLGRIQKEDVEAAASGGSGKGPAPGSQPLTPTNEGAETVALTRMQETIARRMIESKGPVPHFYVSMEVDMRTAVEDLAELNEGAAKEEEVTINDLILRACALALRDYPEVNSSYQDGKFVRHTGVHVGIAVAVQGGLIEPVIRDADRKGLKELAVESKALAHKMREGKAELKDYAGGTFSISNLGMYGVTEFSAIINPPHSAILAIGAVQDKAVVVDGQLAVSKRCTLTLSADHRVFYGATAAEFLRAIKHKLEKPLQLFA